jgi:hypothetical protein
VGASEPRSRPLLSASSSSCVFTLPRSFLSLSLSSSFFLPSGLPPSAVGGGPGGGGWCGGAWVLCGGRRCVGSCVVSSCYNIGRYLPLNHLSSKGVREIGKTVFYSSIKLLNSSGFMTTFTCIRIIDVDRFF